MEFTNTIHYPSETGYPLVTTYPSYTFVPLSFGIKLMKKQAVCNVTTQCQTRILAIKDAMEILSGKWKFHILGTLLLNEKLRFMDLLREVEGIAPKMLSKELQDMEVNQLITRTIVHTKPITVEYALTEAGKTVGPLIDELAKWGTAYREALFNQ